MEMCIVSSAGMGDFVCFLGWSNLCKCACLVLGSILEGPDPEKLKPIVEQAMPMLIELLTDGSVVVRDTAAWTVGRVCEMLPDAVINENCLNPLLMALMKGLEAEPRVASNICWVGNWC